MESSTGDPRHTVPFASQNLNSNRATSNPTIEKTDEESSNTTIFHKLGGQACMDSGSTISTF